MSTLAGDQEEIDDLAHQQQASGEKPDESGDPTAGVEAVDPAETQQAQDP